LAITLRTVTTSAEWRCACAQADGRAYGVSTWHHASGPPLTLQVPAAGGGGGAPWPAVDDAPMLPSDAGARLPRVPVHDYELDSAAAGSQQRYPGRRNSVPTSPAAAAAAPHTPPAAAGLASTNDKVLPCRAVLLFTLSASHALQGLCNVRTSVRPSSRLSVPLIGSNNGGRRFCC